MTTVNVPKNGVAPQQSVQRLSKYRSSNQYARCVSTGTLAHFLHIRRVEGEQMPCYLGVAENCSQGLLELVCQDSEFSQAVGGEMRP
jgi:hypothetical protein